MTKTIVTHSGSFHADEALAIFLLKQLPEYKEAKIIRTRDPAVIATGSIVVDVGGEYKPETLRFDHHQKSFTDTFSSDYDVRLSSAGLIYKHFGKQVLAHFTKDNIDLIYEKTYKDIILSFDAVDNGVSAYPSDLIPKYNDPTTIAARVASLNPDWNDPHPNYDENFLKAIELVGEDFVRVLNNNLKSWLPARDIAKKAFENRFNIHPSGQIVLFEEYCPWKSHLYEADTDNQVLYVLYPDSSLQWRIQAVSIGPNSFTSRKALPEEWRGLRDEELSQLTGISGCVFVHATGFIGGNVNKQGALDMAIAAINK